QDQRVSMLGNHGFPLLPPFPASGLSSRTIWPLAPRYHKRRGGEARVPLDQEGIPGRFLSTIRTVARILTPSSVSHGEGWSDRRCRDDTRPESDPPPCGAGCLPTCRTQPSSMLCWPGVVHGPAIARARPAWAPEEAFDRAAGNTAVAGASAGPGRCH